MARRPAFSDTSGFTLVEVLVAILLLSIGVAGVMTLVNTASRKNADTKTREGATNVARDLIESTRTVPFNNINPTDLAPTLQDETGLADASGTAGWQIRRRNVTYTVTFTACTVDVAADGLGTSTAHASGFCPGQASVAAGGRPDSNPADLKRVTFTVAWTTGQGTQQVVQSALINSTYKGPQLTGITASPAGAITGATASVDFTGNVSGSPRDVKWYLNGRLQGDAAGSGATWTWAWDLGAACNTGSTLDGTYFVSALAYDKNGATGGPKAVTVSLNRCAPNAPTGLQGGINWNSVELAWNANGETDVVGYRVFDSSGNAVCGSGNPISATTCRVSPPPSSGSETYTVKAYDLDGSGNLRAGSASAPLVVSPLCGSGTCNHPPEIPTVSPDTGGGTLSITAPSPADQDSGDTILYYRVYRSSSSATPTSPSARYDIVDNTGSTVTWSDPSPGSYYYWVTAVDSQHAESDFSSRVP